MPITVILQFYATYKGKKTKNAVYTTYSLQHLQPHLLVGSEIPWLFHLFLVSRIEGRSPYKKDGRRVPTCV